MKENILALLARNNYPSKEDWEKLIESRYDIIKPYLESLWLERMGSLMCLSNDQGFGHTLEGAKPPVFGGFSMETEGIFGFQNPSDIEYVPNSGYTRGDALPLRDGRKKIWGITRSGTWILITIDFVAEKGTYKDYGVERATRVLVEEARLTTIVLETKLSYEHIWKKLGEIIQRLANDAKLRYEELRALAERATFEEELVSLIKE